MAKISGTAGACSGGGWLLLLCTAMSAAAQIQPEPAFPTAQLKAPPTSGWLTNRGVALYYEGLVITGFAGSEPGHDTWPADNDAWPMFRGTLTAEQMRDIARYVADDLFSAHAQ